MSRLAPSGMFAGVVGAELAVHDYCDVGVAFQKLHDVLAFSCHGSPTRFCSGILFEAAEASPGKVKIDLLESSALGGFYGVDVVVDLHGCCVFDHGLAPDGEKNVFKRRRHVADLSSDLIGKIGRICHRGTERRRTGWTKSEFGKRNSKTNREIRTAKDEETKNRKTEKPKNRKSRSE